MNTSITRHASVIATGAILFLAPVGFVLLNNATKPPVISTSDKDIETLRARRAKFMAEPPVNTDPTQPKLATAVVGSSVERYACEQATKMQLRDPDSYQKISFEDVGDGSAALNFRSRNGFGGYTEAAAVCTVEGTGVRSIIIAQN